ncbi:hypothetical protein PybrP1_002206 [[Pythium] brassicae (nom. inval.)]|nr:hypothetical protein PybrP1_002206 [[Pythium] brassicae (nom. inval.)]
MTAAYGTFVGPLADLEADSGSKGTAVTAAKIISAAAAAKQLADHNAEKDNDDDDDDDVDGGFEPRLCDCERGDCCFVMALLCAPVRLLTYKVLLFHVANAALALVGAALMLAVVAARLAAACREQAWGASARRFQRSSLLTLLRADAALLNFAASRHELVQVSSSRSLSSSSLPGDKVDANLPPPEDFGVAPQLYFGGAKLVWCALPGAVAASAFVGALQRLLAVALCVASDGGGGSSGDDVCDDALLGDLVPASGGARHFLATAAQDRDVLVLLAVLAVYSATLVLQVSAYVARHAALYCCSDHLRYADAGAKQGDDGQGGTRGLA